MRFSCFLLSVFLFSGLAFSQAKSRYAVVDVQTIILTVDEGKKAKDDISKDIAKKEKEFEKKKQDIEKMGKEVQAQLAIMSEDAKLKKQKEFQDKILALRNEEMTFQTEVKRREQKATQAILAKVQKMVDKIAKEKGFEVVFETNSSGLLFIDNPVDITQDIVKSYNKFKDDSKDSKKK